MAYRLLRALAATMALAAIVVGLPILLVTFGRSPLDGIGTFSEQLHTVLTNPIDDAVALGLVTLITWGLWALFVAQLAVETTIALGRATSWRPPLSGMFELGARQLIAAATMTATLTTTLGQRTSASPNLAPRTTATLVVEDLTPAAAGASALALVGDASSLAAGPAASSSGPATMAPAPGVPVDGPVVTVVPGDSPWELAERHLGEGFRWREIWDLNRGVQQPDGHAWVEEDLIRPGWQLCMPSDAVGLEPPTPPAPAPAPSPPSVPSDGEPEAPTDSATTTSTTSTTSTTAGAADQAAGTPSTDAADGDAPWEDEESSSPAPILLGVAGTVLAAAGLRELRRRRERRQVQLPIGVLPPPPPRVPIDRELLVHGEGPMLDGLEAALVLLAEALRRRSGQPCPRPLVVQLREDRLDVLFETPEPSPPKPWRAEASGLTWVLDDPASLPETDEPCPLPALVTVGADEAPLMIDLEAYGVVSLVGDEPAARSMAESIAAELSTRSEGTVAVHVVGDALDDATTRLDGVRSTAWADVDPAGIAASARLLTTGGWPHTFAARSSKRIWDGWAPTVWITEASDDDTYHQLVATAAEHPGSGTAVLVVGTDAGQGLRVHLSPDGGFHIPQLDLKGRAQGVSGETVDQLADLLEDADEPVTTPVIPFPASATTGLRVTSSSNNGDSGDPEPVYEDPAYDALVRMCGPIGVDGGTEQLPHHETSVVAYVALHGHADVDRLIDKVWDGVNVTHKRVQNVVSAIRRSVGDAVLLDDGLVTAGSGLMTDIELIRRRLAHADKEDDPARRAAVLQGGFDLVTSQVCWVPKAGRRAFTWVELDHWISHVCTLVGQLAHRLAGTYLELGDSHRAAEVADRAIQVTERRDELIVTLVKAHELTGDHAAARSVVRAHEAHLVNLGIDEINEEILDLLDRYSPPSHHHNAADDP